MRKGLEIKTGDDSEIVAAASEGPEEIRIGFVCYVSDASVGEDDLEVIDFIRDTVLY